MFKKIIFLLIFCFCVCSFAFASISSEEREGLNVDFKKLYLDPYAVAMPGQRPIDDIDVYIYKDKRSFRIFTKKNELYNVDDVFVEFRTPINAGVLRRFDQMYNFKASDETYVKVTMNLRFCTDVYVTKSGHVYFKFGFYGTYTQPDYEYASGDFSRKGKAKQKIGFYLDSDMTLQEKANWGAKLRNKVIRIQHNVVNKMKAQKPPSFDEDETELLNKISQDIVPFFTENKRRKYTNSLSYTETVSGEIDCNIYAEKMIYSCTKEENSYDRECIYVGQKKGSCKHSSTIKSDFTGGYELSSNTADQEIDSKLEYKFKFSDIKSAYFSRSYYSLHFDKPINDAGDTSLDLHYNVDFRLDQFELVFKSVLKKIKASKS